jgi:hypothetical protein
MPTSGSYGLTAEGRLNTGGSHIQWVEAKTAGGVLSAGMAEKLLAVKRIGFEHVECKAAH